MVIHLVAEQATVDGDGTAPGYLPKFGIQPAETVRSLARAAKLKPLTPAAADAEPGYRPSATLAQFIRWRDLICRWPGCDAPIGDVDHTVAHPLGPTHPSNLKGYCRVHHLVKTFYIGKSGWAESQSEDGTVTFTSPTGHRYTTNPAGAELFPGLSIPTGPLDLPTASPPEQHRGLAMPTRRQSRDEETLDPNLARTTPARSDER